MVGLGGNSIPWTGKSTARERSKQREIRGIFKILREVWLNIGVEKIDTYKGITVKALLDSDTTGIFMDQKIVMTWQNGQSYFFLFLDLLHRDGVWESIMWPSVTKVTGLWVTVRWCHMTRSYEDHGKIVHRPYSSCISSVGNLTGTPSSSPCQLRPGGWLSHLGLSHYTRTR